MALFPRKPKPKKKSIPNKNNDKPIRVGHPKSSPMVHRPEPRSFWPTFSWLSRARDPRDSMGRQPVCARACARAWGVAGVAGVAARATPFALLRRPGVRNMQRKTAYRRASRIRSGVIMVYSDKPKACRVI